MKKPFNHFLAALISITITSTVSYGQSEKTFISKYLKELSNVPVTNTVQRYRMTAFYTNSDLYGTFTGKTKISGEYTRGLEKGFARWNNIFISNSNSLAEPFPAGQRQDYMENMTYIPSPKMLESTAFKDFPAKPETVISRNLIWDMMAIEGFAWDHTDSLKLNVVYRIPDMDSEFNMADIGTYSHAEIQLCWTGISAINDELFAVIEYRALDNKLEMSVNGLNTKGTEQYWGTVWVSIKDKLIGKAEMYGGTLQEIEVPGMENKFIVKTIRELFVDKIQ